MTGELVVAAIVSAFGLFILYSAATESDTAAGALVVGLLGSFLMVMPWVAVAL